MQEHELLIIGGGPAGLSLAMHVHGDRAVLERETEVGGLCRSFEIGGGMFDVGGHSFHTPHPEVSDFIAALMGDRWETQTRDARVLTHGTTIPYPFQRHFHLLPDVRVIEECQTGLREARGSDDAANFEQWILARFGGGIARHFMLPYNRKLWARDLKRMSREWTGERVAVPVGASESFAVSGGKRKPLQADTTVGYPSEGGFVEICRAMAAKVPTIHTCCEVAEIHPAERSLVTRDGRAYRWRRVVSTLPIPLLLRMLRPVPEALLARAERLEHLSLHLLMLLAGKPLPRVPQRLYIADPEVPPHKIAFNHTSSRSLRMRPVHAITAEISYSAEKPLGPLEEIERKTVAALVDAGMLGSAEDLVHRESLDVPHAYPVNTPDRNAIVSEVKDWLKPLGIHTLGRFGEWDYINSDECIKRGMDLAVELDGSRSRSRDSEFRCW
jgi:protoporphyrinogen oxidase